MRILIYGAGVLGSTYAAKLKKAGHEVTLLARGRRAELIRENGLTLVNALTGRQTITHVAVAERLDPQEFYDLIVVLVRSNQVESVLPNLAANRETPSILFMLNNAGGPAKYLSCIAENRVILGFPGAGGTRSDSTVTYALLPGWFQATTIGELHGERSKRIKVLAAMFRNAGFPTAISRNMDAWLRTHVAAVVPLAGAIYMAESSNYLLAKDKKIITTALYAIRESFKALESLGINVTPSHMSKLAKLPMGSLTPVAARLLNTPFAELVITRHATTARSEVNYLAQQLLSLVKQAGHSTPALDTIYGGATF